MRQSIDFFSFLKIGKRAIFFIIFTLIIGLFSPVLAAPKTATLFVQPSNGTETVGSNFTVDFQVNTGGQAAAAVQVDVTYSANLQYISVDPSSSVFDLDLGSPNPSNNHFMYSRAILNNSAYNGSNGQIARFTFKPLSAGTGTITININSSQVLADSDNSNILNAVTNGSYTLASAATPTPTPAPTATPASGSNNGGSQTSGSTSDAATPTPATKSVTTTTTNNTTNSSIVTSDNFKAEATDTTVKVTFQTKSAVTRILYVDTKKQDKLTSYSKKTTESKATKDHSLTMEKLTPATNYHGVIATTSGLIANEFDFQTTAASVATATSPTPVATTASTNTPSPELTVVATPILNQPESKNPTLSARVLGWAKNTSVVIGFIMIASILLGLALWRLFRPKTVNLVNASNIQPPSAPIASMPMNNPPYNSMVKPLDATTNQPPNSTLPSSTAPLLTPPPTNNQNPPQQ